MGRPPLPVGSWGDIRVRRTTREGELPERWRAIAQFRDRDGHTRQVERYDSSEAKARNTLRRALSDRAGIKGLTADSRFEKAALLWLDQVRGEVADSTHDRYRTRLHTTVLPRLGQLKLHEATPAAMSGFLADLKADGHGPGSRRSMRTVVSGVLDMAVNHDLLASNAIKGMRIRGDGPARRPRAYDADTLADFLAKLDGDKRARNADLPDLLRTLFGTGCRFGEALAVRWCDLNLTDAPVTVVEPITGAEETLPAGSLWVNGNLVHVTGKGVVRHTGKTFRSTGVIILPGFLRTLLMVRRPAEAGPGDPVFPAPFGGWRQPANVQRSVRTMRRRIHYPGFTTHIGRKTVATLLDEGGQSARQIADQLRHANPSMTLNAYMGRNLPNAAAAEALDAAHRSPAT